MTNEQIRKSHTLKNNYVLGAYGRAYSQKQGKGAPQDDKETGNGKSGKTLLQAINPQMVSGWCIQRIKIRKKRKALKLLLLNRRS
jgi:hypothetical protein